jgi:hypothetical protein
MSSQYGQLARMSNAPKTQRASPHSHSDKAKKGRDRRHSALHDRGRRVASLPLDQRAVIVKRQPSRLLSNANEDSRAGERRSRDQRQKPNPHEPTLSL